MLQSVFMIYMIYNRHITKTNLTKFITLQSQTGSQNLRKYPFSKRVMEVWDSLTHGVISASSAFSVEMRPDKDI